MCIRYSGYGYETAYGHMSKLAVQAGQSVSKGDVIGYVGSSGYSTGPNRRFAVYNKANPI